MEKENVKRNMFEGIDDDFGFDTSVYQKSNTDSTPQEERNVDEPKTGNPPSVAISVSPKRVTRKKNHIALPPGSNGTVAVEKLPRLFHLIRPVTIYLAFISKRKGVSMSKYVEDLLLADIKKNQLFYDKYVKEFLED